MGLDLELKGKLQITMPITTNRENERVPQEPLNNNQIDCLSNFEDRTMDAGEEPRNSDGEDVGIHDTEQMNSRNHNEPIEAECGDETEYSSSYGDTLSGTESGPMMNDGEVESQFFFDNALPPDFDEFGGTSQSGKKKLTDHWRKFIGPLMWRCKWLELQVKEMETMAQKYDRRVEEYDRQKEFQLGNFTSDGFNAEALPFSNQMHTNNNELMMRRKRKQVEVTTDTSAYISSHNIFSYTENRKSLAESPPINKYCGKFDVRTNNVNDVVPNNGLLGLELSKTDNSLVHILYKIDEIQSQTRSLKNRVDQVVNENPAKFSSINRLNLMAPTSETFTSSDRNPASPNAGDNRMPVGSMYNNSLQHVSNDAGDLFMPESPIADLLEPGSLCEANEDVFLIHKAATKEELHNFERVLSQVTERPRVIIPPVTTVKTELLSDITKPDEESPSTSRPNVANNKRKRRAKRKSGSDAWKLKLGSR